MENNGVNKMTEKMDISVVSHESCTGCGACKAICPKGAIKYEPDAAGFPMPVIEGNKCIHCGLCEKTCPAVHPPVRQQIREAYAAQILDKEALKVSTSGGMFTVFSREIFRRGGAVFGCIWDKDYNAVIVQANNEQEIAPMRGSKYVWSNASEAYPQVKAVLKAGRPVLFTGLPCQAAGLRNYLGQDYENLIIMDCLCSGTPSPMAFQSWLDTIVPAGMPKSELNLKFRDKNPYGVGVHITYKGMKGKTRRAREHILNPYYYTFYCRMIDRESCFHCTYGTDQRVSDITMADYWGIVNYHKSFNIPAGVSALLVNTEKGQALLESVKSQIQLETAQPTQIGKANNLACNGATRKIYRPPLRDNFLKAVSQQGWKKAERKYLWCNKSRVKSLLGTIGFVARLKKKIRG